MIFGLRTKLAVAGVSLALAFGSGWLVCSKFNAAGEARELRAILKAQNEETARLKSFNEAAALREKAMLEQVAAMNSAIGKILNEVRDLDMGACSFTPDSDRLRSEAHRQAYPPR